MFVVIAAGLGNSKRVASVLEKMGEMGEHLQV